MSVNSYKIILALLLFFAGCSADHDNTSVIRFWSMGAEAEYVTKLIPMFEKENPGILVEVQQIPWTAAQEKLITAYASNNLPDVFQLGNTWVPQFKMLNAIEVLDERIISSNEISDTNYFNGIWHTNVIDNSVYGIPWYIDTRVLYYRKDVLQRNGYEHPPKSWDELLDLSQKVKSAQKDTDKYSIYLPTNEWAPFIIFGMQNGAQLLKKNNCYGNFHSDKFKSAFEYLINFHKEKLAPIGISQVNNVYQAFVDEYFSMYISGPWNIREFKKWMGGDLKDAWGTAPLPGPDSTYPGLSLAGGSSLVISKNSTKQNEAWKFIEYLSRPEIQLEFYKLINDLPAVKSAWEDSTLANDRYMRAFHTQFSNVIATPKIAEWEQIAFSKVQQYAEYAARGVMSVDETLIKLDEDVDRILEKRRKLIGVE